MITAERDREMEHVCLAVFPTLNTKQSLHARKICIRPVMPQDGSHPRHFFLPTKNYFFLSLLFLRSLSSLCSPPPPFLCLAA